MEEKKTSVGSSKNALIAAAAVAIVAVIAIIAIVVIKNNKYANAPDEAGYYVVFDDFIMVSPNAWSENGYSSWDNYSPTALVTRQRDGATYVDNSEYVTAEARREFNALSEDFVWEFMVQSDATLDGSSIDMRSGEVTAISFYQNGSALELVTADGNISLGALDQGRFIALKLEISPEKGTYNVMADGVLAAENVAFLNPCTSLDQIYVKTSETGTGAVTLGTIRIYTGYYVNEKFLNADTYIPEDWMVTGDVSTMWMQGTQGPDYYHAVLADGAEMTKDVTYEQEGFWLEYQLLLPTEGAASEFSMILEDEKGKTFVVATKDGQFGYYDGDNFVALYDCLDNMWYHVMVKDTDEGGMLYLNHKEKAEGIKLPIKKFTKITFKSQGGSAWLDDILLKDWIPYPEDYVPEPQAAVKEENAPLVGLQSCNLWVEGTHFGWDWISNWPDRTPVLGLYDETSAETADWELLYKVEHGIDFELFCWYRSQSGQDAPIKANRNGTALHEGYFNAKYSDMMKFAITWECNGGPVSGSEDFRENVVPYWIEQYFKDDRYLVIDNKPVVGMYSVSKLMGYFGNTAEGVKAELDYLRQACVDAGFDGCYIIMSNSASSEIANVEAAGFDGQYAYSWGLSSENISYQKSSLEAFDAAAKEAGGKAGVIPVASMGRSDEAWERSMGSGGYCTIEDFTELLRWMKEDYMPTLDQDTLGSKMVLLDNWNEYGEGHFIMPSEGLYGFGYLDAVAEVFGGAKEHEDVIPTENQRERINHMYVQDRVVEKVEISTVSDEDLEVRQGFYYETAGDLEGWKIGVWKGENLDVEKLEAKGGAMVGNTHLGDANYADPAIESPALSLTAGEIVQIRVRMKSSAEVTNSELYFMKDDDTSFAQKQCLQSSYKLADAEEDGYTTVIFETSSNDNWKGTITQVRLDPIVVAGSFEIDSVEFLCRKGTGDASVYLGGTKIYNATPIIFTKNMVLYPLKELDIIADNTWAERFDGSGVDIMLNEKAVFGFTYDEKEIVINGQKQKIAQGATVIDGEIYVPIAPMFMNANYDVIWTSKDKKLDLIKKRDVEGEELIAGFYYNSDNEGWVRGGALNAMQWSEGHLYVTAGDENIRVWTSETKMVGVPAADVTHVRICLKTDVAGPKDLTAVIKTSAGDVTKVVTYEEGEDGYATVTIPVADFEGYDTASTINRLGFYLFKGNVGSHASIDYVELLKIDPNVATE